MLIAYLQNGERVYIRKYDEKLHKGNITCVYGHPLIAKRGEIKIHHYAHTNKCGGNHHDNKGLWHITFQSMLKDDCLEIHMKDSNGAIKHIADIVCGNKVIELQKSIISIQDMRERESFYIGKGYEMIWIFCCTRETNVDLATVNKVGDIITLQLRSGNKFILNAGKNVKSYLDTGTLDILEIITIKKNTITCRVLRFKQFMDQIIGIDYQGGFIMEREQTFITVS
jgi:hypothetical protein